MVSQIQEILVSHEKQRHACDFILEISRKRKVIVMAGARGLCSKEHCLHASIQPHNWIGKGPSLIMSMQRCKQPGSTRQYEQKMVKYRY